MNTTIKVASMGENDKDDNIEKYKKILIQKNLRG